MSGADDLDAIVKNEQPDRRAHQIITVHQGVDQQLLEHRFRDFRLPGRVHTASRLEFVQIAHHKSDGVLENFRQRPGKVFRICIIGRVNPVSGIADRLEHKLWLDQFRLFGKYQQSGQVQFSVIGGQVHVLEQAGQLCRIVRVVLFVDVPQEVAEAQLVQLVDAGLGGQLVGMELVGHLEQTAQFLLGVHPPLIRAGLQPDHAVLVKVRFIETFGHGQHDHDAAIFERDVLC